MLNEYLTRTRTPSRRDEQEADKIGVELAGAAGYRAELLAFLDALHELEGERR
jgi:predicted Zn-dependent protease